MFPSCDIVRGVLAIGVANHLRLLPALRILTACTIPKGDDIKKSVVVLLACLVATSAYATIDPDLDMIGVYFDMNADINCIAENASVPFFAYVIITNPSAALVYGVEFGYGLRTVPAGLDASIFRLAEILPVGALNVGNSDDKMIGDYIIGFAAPVPGAGQNILVVTWQYMLLAPMGLEFHLGPAVTESIPDGLPAYEIGGIILPLGVSTGHPNLGIPAATVNGDCAVATEDFSFGRVKSLFR